jgi:hypothetical protein
MVSQLVSGSLVSFLNFGIHAVMTGLVVVATRHTAAATDDFHVFVRVTALLLVTTVFLMAGHLLEIAVWTQFYHMAGVTIQNVTAFEFAFENYTALGYGDGLAINGWRLIGPITSLNGLLLIGWSVAIIFEVMRMAEVQVARLGDGKR